MQTAVVLELSSLIEVNESRLRVRLTLLWVDDGLVMMMMMRHPQRTRLFDFSRFFPLLHFDLWVPRLLSSKILGYFQSGGQHAEWAI